MICKQCGKEIPENSNFCTFCGAAQPVTEPVQEQAPQPEAPAPAAEPELVVEPGPAPEAPPAPELVFDLPAPEPEAAPAPKAEEPAPMPLPDPAPMPLPDPVADPAPKEEGPAPMPLPDPVPTPGNGPANGPVGGPPPVPPTPAQPAGAANESSVNVNVSFDLVLKIFASTCAVFAAIAMLQQIPDLIQNLLSILLYQRFAAVLYIPENLIAMVGYLLMVLALVLLAFFRTKANTEALCSGLLAGAVLALAACILRACVSLLQGIFGSFYFLYSAGAVLLGVFWVVFWLAACLAGIWGLLYLMKAAPAPLNLVKDIPGKYSVIVETIKSVLASTKA